MPPTAAEKQADYAQRHKTAGYITASIPEVDDSTPISSAPQVIDDIVAQIQGFESWPEIHQKLRSKFVDGVWKRHYDSTLKNPEVATVLAPLTAAQNLFIQDLHVDGDPVDRPNFNIMPANAGDPDGYWETFKRVFVRQELSKKSWIEIHKTQWQLKTLSQGKRTVSDYVDAFLSAEVHVHTSPLPSSPDWVVANQFFAGLDEHLAASLVELHPATFLPQDSHTWVYATVSRLAAATESAPKYQKDKAARTSLAKLNQQLAAISSTTKELKVAAAAQVAATEQHGNKKKGNGKNNSRQRDPPKAKGFYKSNGHYEFPRPSVSWNSLTDAQKTANGRTVSAARDCAASDLVPGVDGKLVRTKADKAAVCNSFPGCHLKSCGKAGHYNSKCPLNNESYDASRGEPSSDTPVAPAGLAALQEQVAAIANGMKLLSDDDPTVMKNINLAPVFQVTAAGSTSALIIPDDRGVPILFDTGSRHNIMSMTHYNELMQKGNAGPLQLPEAGTQYIGASGDSLGYAHDGAADFAFANAVTRLPVRVMTELDDSFHPIAGLDAQRALGCTISHPLRTLFVDVDGAQAAYPFDNEFATAASVRISTLQAVGAVSFSPALQASVALADMDSSIDVELPDPLFDPVDAPLFNWSPSAVPLSHQQPRQD